MRSAGDFGTARITKPFRQELPAVLRPSALDVIGVIGFAI